MDLTPDTKFSIYILIDPRTGEIRYVGCTIHLSRRAADHRRLSRAVSKKSNWIKELHGLGFRPDIAELIQVSASEQWWTEEENWIRRLTLAGCELLNTGTRDAMLIRMCKGIRKGALSYYGIVV